MLRRVFLAARERHEERRLEESRRLLEVSRESLAARDSFRVEDIRKFDGRDGGPVLIGVYGDGVLPNCSPVRCHPTLL